MKIEIRNDAIILDGYVNAVDRLSRPIPSVRGDFVERIKPGAFRRALEKADNVDLLLNHDESRKLGSTQEENLTLFEDNIGLRGIGKVTDPEVIEKAKHEQLRGWSFGFYVGSDTWETRENDYPIRTVEELELFEVSILDDSKIPAYVGTSIEMRDGKEVFLEQRGLDSLEITVIYNEKQEEEPVEEPTEERAEEIDFSQYYNILNELRKGGE